MPGTEPKALFASVSKSLQKAVEGNAVMFAILHEEIESWRRQVID